MHTPRTIALLSVMSFVAVALPLGGCEQKAQPPTPAKADASATKPAAAMPAGTSAGHDDGHHHGETTQLGEQTAGGFTIKASRDGDITPGTDAAIDVWVTGGTAKVTAVRFWIGAQDGKGSVKAKADIENDHWHTHAEIPSPLPTGSKLWVEVEADGGSKVVVGFELKI